jgi:hypothetical protein
VRKEAELSLLPSVIFLLTLHCLDRIRAFYLLPVSGFPYQGGGSITALDTSFLSFEMEQKVEITISIHIFNMALAVGFRSSVWSKLDA